MERMIVTLLITTSVEIVLLQVNVIKIQTLDASISLIPQNIVIKQTKEDV
jgi:hypothetical protein